ncbi:glycosyl transferase, partial [Aureobasidium melanogenum]
MLRDNSLHSETMHRMLDKELDVLNVRTLDKKRRAPILTCRTFTHVNVILCTTALYQLQTSFANLRASVCRSCIGPTDIASRVERQDGFLGISSIPLGQICVLGLPKQLALHSALSFTHSHPCNQTNLNQPYLEMQPARHRFPLVHDPAYRLCSSSILSSCRSCIMAGIETRYSKMVRRPSTTSTFTDQRAGSTDGGRDDRAQSINAATDVIIPSTLLNALGSGPYESHTNQFQSDEHQNTSNGFDVREVAQRLHEETNHILARSASVSVAGLTRPSPARSELDFRKTSLEPNFGSALRHRGLSPRTDQGRHALSTVTEGRATANDNPATTSDYFASTHLIRWKCHKEGSNYSHDIDEIRVSTQRPRRSTVDGSRKESIVQRSASVVLDTVENVKQAIRRSSIHDVYEKAKKRGLELQRSKWAMRLFEYTFYLILVAFVYFVLIGLPLWKGAVYWLYWVFKRKFASQLTDTCRAVTIGIAFIYAYTPLFVFFEKDPPMPADLDNIDPTRTPGVHNTALMIPCYKSAKIIGPTLDAALKIFPPSHIFVIANGNSPTPLDDTEVVCRPYGVNHVWSPVGSKIVAQFVGCYAARGFKNVLLIDDDCALPPNFPIVSDRMTPMIKCIGYTIKSVGPESSRGTLCQQAQDLEYKISGIQRALAGYIGSATFPHGAISLWDRQFLIETFYKHPGFSVSEDWFFGHVARQLGSRITMCTRRVWRNDDIQTTILSLELLFRQWPILQHGLYHRFLETRLLGVRSETVRLPGSLRDLVVPFVAIRPSDFDHRTPCLLRIFVCRHIRAVLPQRRDFQRVASEAEEGKIVLTLVNVGSCYWSLYKYAQYFARRHPKIVEDEKAVDVVLRMEEQHDTLADQGRRMTITAVGAQTQGSVVEQTPSGPTERKMTVTALGPKLDIQPMSPVAEQPEVFTPAIRLQGERVSFTSLRSNSSSVRIERLPSQTSEGISPSQYPGASLVHTTTPEKADTKSLDHHSSRGRRSGSIRSDSLRRSTSLPRSQTSADFASPGFEELMDRLAVIESRLNPHTVSAVEVSIAEETRPISAPEIRFPIYALPIDEGEEDEEEEEGYELYDLEKLDSGKTEESKNNIWFVS